MTRRDFLRHTYTLEAARAGHADASERANLLVCIDEEVEARELTRVEAAAAIGADAHWFARLSQATTSDLEGTLERIAAVPRMAQPRG